MASGKVNQMRPGYSTLEGQGRVSSINRLRQQVTTSSKGYLELNLNGRELRAVPPETFQLVATQVLRLTNNYIDYLPLTIAYLRALKVLDLQHNQLVHLPETLVNCRHLMELDLTANRLTELPRGIRELKNLRVLSLGENKFEHLSDEMGFLTSLKKLDLHSNKLWHLPFSLQGLKRLLQLNVRDNVFDHVPLVVTKIASLQMLDLSKNRLASLPFEFAALTSLRELNLSHNSFVCISSLLVTFKHLKYLSLANNRLVFLPPQMPQLQNLRVLHLQHNSLTRVPCQLRNLQYYNVSANQLGSFSVEGMRSLVSLTASSNYLEAVPKGLFKLKKLKSLRLDNNKLMNIDEDIRLLHQLRVLDLSNNKLITLPSSLYRLAKLHSFTFKGNHNLKRYDIRTSVHIVDTMNSPDDRKDISKMKNEEYEKYNHRITTNKYTNNGDDMSNVMDSAIVDDIENGANHKQFRTRISETRDKHDQLYRDGLLRSSKTSSDWELHVKPGDSYNRHQNLLKLQGIVSRSSTDNLGKKHAASEPTIRAQKLSSKGNSLKGLKDFLFGKSKIKITARSDVGRSDPLATRRYLEPTQLRGKPPAGHVSTGNRNASLTRHSGRARSFSSRDHRGQLAPTQKDHVSAPRDCGSGLKNMTPFFSPSDEGSKDADSKSDSHGYGTWGSNIGREGYRSETYNSLQGNTNTFVGRGFNEVSQGYRLDNVGQQRNDRFVRPQDGLSRRSFSSDAASSDIVSIPFHLRSKPKSCTDQEYRSAGQWHYQNKQHAVNNNEEYIENGRAYSSLDNDTMWQEHHFGSHDKSGQIRCRCQLNNIGNRQGQLRTLFTCRTSSKDQPSNSSLGTLNKQGPDSQRTHAIRSSFTQGTNLQDKGHPRSPARQKNPGYSMWPYAIGQQFLPKYNVVSEEKNIPEAQSLLLEASQIKGDDLMGITNNTTVGSFTEKHKRGLGQGSDPIEHNTKINAGSGVTKHPGLLKYTTPQTFTMTSKGGEFVSHGGSKVKVSFPAYSVAKTIHITVQEGDSDHTSQM